MPSAWGYLICRGLTSTTNGKYAWPMAASSTKGIFSPSHILDKLAKKQSSRSRFGETDYGC